jgi:hypothetical protein
MELEKVKSLIKEAFSDVAYPGDDHIAGCGRINCDDCDVIAAHFKGTTWQEHNSQTLIGCGSAPSFLYTEALHYYLPAFLLAELDDDTAELLPNLYDNIAWNYSPKQEERLQSKVKENVNLLSLSQREALIEFFKYHCIYEGVYDPDPHTLETIDFLQAGP